MAGDSSIFLAYREAGQPLRYYLPDPSSEEHFHFYAFADGLNLDLPMKAVASPPHFTYHFNGPISEPSKAAQIRLLEETISQLKSGAGEKVVISRLKLSLNPPQALEVLQNLDQLYPQATVYLFSHPEAGTWLGASPEQLLKVEAGHVTTASLAGTRLWEERQTFTEKEFEEQAIVSEAIYQKLAQFGLQALHLSERQIKQAGNLAHLFTEITGQLAPGQDPKRLAAVLHPTPAVGGFPQDWALNFIKQKELYPRRYYTGYFGWTHQAKAEARFWVNLRCAQYLSPNTLGIYVGGGITAQSDAQAEWEETENKAQTILKALN